jgi:hypothetical protein
LYQYAFLICRCLKPSLKFPDIRIKIGEPLPEATYDNLPQLMNAYVSHSYNRGYGVVLGYKGKANKLGNRTIYWWASREIERTKVSIQVESVQILALGAAIARSRLRLRSSLEVVGEAES